MINGMQTAHFDDCAARAERSGRPVYTAFLDPAERELAVQAANKRRVEIAFDGGYEDAERQVAAFGDADELYWPVCPLQIVWDKRFGTLAHKDLLGSVMALGIERGSFGDIVVNAAQGYAVVFALDSMADYLKANWESAGRTSISVRDLPSGVGLPPPEGRTYRLTVASMRLDAVLAGVFKLSRAEAAEIIRQGRVRVNFVEREGVDYMLSPGDLVSARGVGRMRIIENQGETRKGRLGLNVFQYSK